MFLKEVAEGYRGQSVAEQAGINAVRGLIKTQLNEISAAGVQCLFGVLTLARGRRAFYCGSASN